MHEAKRNISSIEYKIDVVIPAAGCGARMRRDIAKPLLRINNIPIINRNISILSRKRTVNNIFCIFGKSKDLFLDSITDKCTTVYNPFYRTTNIVDSLRYGILRSNAKRLLIVYGDLVYDKDIFKDLSLAESTIYTQQQTTMGKNEVGCTFENGYLSKMMWGLENTWCQILYLY